MRGCACVCQPCKLQPCSELFSRKDAAPRGPSCLIGKFPPLAIQLRTQTKTRGRGRLGGKSREFIGKRQTETNVKTKRLKKENKTLLSSPVAPKDLKHGCFKLHENARVWAVGVPLKPTADLGFPTPRTHALEGGWDLTLPRLLWFPLPVTLSCCQPGMRFYPELSPEAPPPLPGFTRCFWLGYLLSPGEISSWLSRGVLTI